MNKGIVYLWLFIALFYHGHVVAQAEVTPLTFNDQVPDVSFTVTQNYPAGSGKLSDFKGKAVILDFWNENCTACIAGFPKLQKLQQEFGDQLQILLVTKDKKATILKLAARSPVMKKIQLPLVMEDTLLYNKLFPHFGDPYQVWLDKDGKVKAMTQGSSATPKNVQDLINGKTLQLPVIANLTKEEYGDMFGAEYYEYGVDNPKIYYQEPISLLKAVKGKYLSLLRYYKVLQPSIPNGFPSGYYSLFTQHLGELPAHPENTRLKNDSGRYAGSRWTNISLLRLVNLAYNLNDSILKIIVEKDVPVELPPLGKPGEFDYEQWVARNGYCYEAVIANYSKENFYRQMQKDIEQYFGIIATIEERTADCLILYRVTEKDLLRVKDSTIKSVRENTRSDMGWVLLNDYFLGFISDLMIYNQRYDNYVNGLPVIDETGIDVMRKIDMTLKVKTLHHADPNLQKELAKYGLGLRRETRQQKVLVIKKSTTKL